MRTGGFAVGDYSVGRFTHKQVVSFALPFLDRAGERGGVVAVSVDLAWFAKEVGGPEWNGDQIMTIADRNGHILVRQPNDNNYIGQLVPKDIWAFAAALKAPATRDITSSLDGRIRIVGLVPPSAGPGGFLVAAGISRDAAFHDLKVSDQRSWLGTGVVTLGSLVLAWLFGQRLIRAPIGRLIATTRKWRGGEYGARAAMTGSSEIHELGRSFDDMADALEEALQHKDMLLRELSHRVMNSLQTIAALFRLQARQVKDPQARAQFANAVTRINSVALAYRRMQAEAGVELVDFAAFLRELCADLHQSLMPASAPCDVQADPVMLGADQAMPLALIVNELIINALKHGARDQPVTVLLGRSTDGCRLAVRSGGALPAGYDPMETAGFGMQMVNLIVKQLNGKLEASSMGGQTEFAVSFVPVVPQPTILTVISGSQHDGASGLG
jgi:two-component sensor histidine kinase